MQPDAGRAVDEVEQASPSSQCERAGEADCPWCGEHRSKLVWRQTSRSEFSIHRCEECGLAYTVPQLSLESMSQYYPKSYYGSGNLRFNRLFEVLVGWFRRRRAARLHELRGRRAGAVLDIGCGRGHFLNALRQRGWTCTGTELSDTAALHARETLALDVRVGPFQAGMFPDATFDVVYLWHVLEHIPATYDALIAVQRLLRTGGMLVVALPNLASWQARLCRYGWFHLDLPRHYVHCSTDWLLRSLSQLGFEIVEVNHFSMEQNVYGWIQSLLNCAGLKKNLLYDVLRNRSARDVARPFRTYPVQAVISVIAAAILLPLATLAMLAEVLFRRGGTIEVYAARGPVEDPVKRPESDTGAADVGARGGPVSNHEPSSFPVDRHGRT
jgi:2-polyprenyl-3-methyl-5-hydroxy-6-metoxy-1,4-benzoquinol methylase